MLSCLGISSTMEISPLLVYSASLKFSGHEQNATRFFARVSHKWLPGQKTSEKFRGSGLGARDRD